MNIVTYGWQPAICAPFCGSQKSTTWTHTVYVCLSIMFHSGNIDINPRLQDKLTVAIDTFLDRLCIIDPTRIITKPKCHILTHIIADIRRFGPAPGLSTETFESYNGVFRACSIHSNHQSPSKDIALQIADMDRFKHIASGGRWLHEGRWVRPGKDIIYFFRNNATLHTYLGWTDQRIADKRSAWASPIYELIATDARLTGGTVQKPGMKKRKTLVWGETLASKSIPCNDNASPANVDLSSFHECLSCVSNTLDDVRIRTFVIVNHRVSPLLSISDSQFHSNKFWLQRQDSDAVGRVAQILEQVGEGGEDRVLVVLRKFYTGGRHTNLNMPTLHVSRDEEYILATIKV